MTTTSMILLVIGAGLVTWIPRVVPFIFVRSVTLPDVVLKWLSFIPVSILSALVIENLLNTEEAVVTLDLPVVAAFLPTLAVALWTKSLSFTVIVGVVSMAVVRYFI